MIYSHNVLASILIYVKNSDFNSNFTRFQLFVVSLHNMNTTLTNEKWSENVILVDADYTDKVAFDLIVNFERMIGRHIPKADMAKWIDCIALDGGLRHGDHETQVVFIHSKNSQQMENFTPGQYRKELDGKAFKDQLGEFLLSCIPVEDIVKADDFFLDALSVIANCKDVKRIMVIPNAEKIYDDIKQALRYADEDKHITVFAMQPMAGGNFRQEILGYSLMSALGISADEIEKKIK